VAPQSLTDEQQVLAGSSHYDVVRIVSAGGAVVDVATRRAPRSWPRWKTIDEPAEAVGLPLATTGGPRPAPAPAEGAAWPSEPATLLLAADGIGWRPGTPLGRLGMDYALFDSVEDGRRIEGGDNAALFALLAAAGRPEAAMVRKTSWRAGDDQGHRPQGDPGCDRRAGAARPGGRGSLLGGVRVRVHAAPQGARPAAG
jgi:hypothetical protein